jgi:hypothetical protein
VKCGRTVEAPKTGFPFLDWPDKVHEWLTPRLGPVWSGLVTVALFLLLFLLFFGGILLKTVLSK